MRVSLAASCFLSFCVVSLPLVLRCGQGGETIENVVAFEIAAGRHVVGERKKFGIARTEDVLDLGARPHIELAFLAFGVRIERGAEGTLRRRHLACEPADRFLSTLPEQVVAAADMGEREKLEELGVVVHHLLEMRYQPALIDGVAREAAAEVIVDPALAHCVERQFHQFEEPPVAAADAGAPQHLQHRALREFRRAAEPAIDGIERAGDGVCGGVELAGADHHLVGGPRLVRERRHQRIAIVLDALRLLAEQPGDLLITSTKPGRP